MKKIAVVLSGCGHLNGTEINEAVCTLIALGNEKADYVCFAPTMWMDESAKISRGQITDLNELNVSDFDALVFPGGYGAAKNLSTWAEKGARAEVLPEVSKAIRAFHAEGKPIGAICIAPALIACVLGAEGPTLTIGNDPETVAEIQKTGAVHENCDVEDYVSDRLNKILTTPAYMFETKPHLIYRGITKMIKELVEMA